MTMGQRGDIPMRNHRILQALRAGTSIDDVADEHELSAAYIATIAREAGHVPKHDQPADGSLSERDQFIVSRALEGDTFSDIGRDYGISRERVRQIVKKHEGVGARDGLQTQRRKARHGRAMQAARDLAAKYPDMKPAEIGHEVGLTANQVRLLMGRDEAIRRRTPKVVAVDVTDEQVFAELRRIAALPGGTPLSSGFYEKNRGPGTLHQTRVLQRFETWRNVCALAGVEANQPPAGRSYTRTWNRENLLDWVSKYVDTTEKPTYAGMDRWLRMQAGAPSAQTVRNYIGNWTVTLKATVERRFLQS